MLLPRLEHTKTLPTSPCCSSPALQQRVGGFQVHCCFFGFSLTCVDFLYLYFTGNPGSPRLLQFLLAPIVGTAPKLVDQPLVGNNFKDLVLVVVSKEKNIF